MVLPFVNGSWRLDANISWDRPQGIYFDAYAVDLDYTPTLSTANSCDAEYSKFMITETEWIYLENIPFGFTPHFIVYTASRTYQLINKAPNDNKMIEFLDCYETTRSLSFCRALDVQVAGKPIGLNVTMTEAEERLQGSNQTARVSFTWHPPVHINSRVVLTAFRVLLVRSGRQVASATVPVPESQRNYSDPFSLSFSNTFEGVEVIADNETLLMVYAQVDNAECSFPSCVSGSIASIPIYFRLPHTDYVPVTVASVVGSLVLASCVLLLLCLTYRRCRRSDNVDDDTVIFHRSHKDSNLYIDAPNLKAKPKECFARTEIERSLLSIIGKDSEIGKGSFGVVYKGFAFGAINGKLDYYPVALKGLRGSATSDMKSSFMQEIALMIEIGSHPNILSVLGCCTVDEPYYLITEFMEYGDLLHFLWKTKDKQELEEDSIYHLTELNQLQIALQIARGMEYISKTRYYHGDLAARNILLGGNLIVKISDFGLADDIYERGYKQNDSKVRPVKWASLETVTKGRYSIASDVWSFGIVLYEIFTRGDIPYQGFNNKELLVQLREGYRLEQPTDCPDEMYEIMRKCWQENPSSRPTFTNLVGSLDNMLEEHADYLRFDSPENGTADKLNEDYPLKTQVSSRISGRPDELKLWLHVHGPIPEEAKTIEFVPLKNEAEDSIPSESLTRTTSANGEKTVYERDRDCDILSV